MATTDYSRGYNKGRSTGERKADEALAKLHEQAVAASARAERAEKAAGIGHCEDCKHWRRGGGSANAHLCAWGTCAAPRAYGTPYGTWANDDGKAVQTTPRFGCVLFLPRPDTSEYDGDRP